MTRDDAQHLLDTYCDDVPREDAVERLMASTFSEADAASLNEPGNAAIQDRLDEIIYGTISYDGAITLQRSEEHLRDQARTAEQAIRYREDGEVSDDEQAAPHILDAEQANAAAYFIEAHWRKHV